MKYKSHEHPNSIKHRFGFKITNEDIDTIIKLKKEGKPTWLIANTVVGGSEGRISHQTAFRWIRLDYDKLEEFRGKVR
jgi:hypothetical protein